MFRTILSTERKNAEKKKLRYEKSMLIVNSIILCNNCFGTEKSGKKIKTKNNGKKNTATTKAKKG